MTVRVAPALSPLQSLLVSKRRQREARRWPWAWWCTTCDAPDACGAAKTRQAAQEQADQHIARRHPKGTR